MTGGLYTVALKERSKMTYWRVTLVDGSVIDDKRACIFMEGDFSIKLKQKLCLTKTVQTGILWWKKEKIENVTSYDIIHVINKDHLKKAEWVVLE